MPIERLSATVELVARFDNGQHYKQILRYSESAEAIENAASTAGISPMHFLARTIAQTIAEQSDIQTWRPGGEADPMPLTPDQLPAPDTLIDYGGGHIAPLMFHFATDEEDWITVAENAGFELKTLWLESDDANESLQAQYVEGLDVLPLWTPPVPEGWKFAGKGDTDEGPVAYFLRPLAQQV